MGCYPEARTSTRCTRVKPSVRAKVARNGVPQVGRAIVVVRFIRLLRAITKLREIAIEITGEKLICDDGRHRRQTDVKLAPPMMRSPIDSPRCNFRLEDR